MIAALWSLLRSFAPWLAAPLAASIAWGARDWTAAGEAKAAAARSREICELTWRTKEALAEAQAERSRREIENHMRGVRPDPGLVPDRLREGSFFANPDALRDSLPAGRGSDGATPP